MAGFDKIGKDTGPGDGGFLITTKETTSKVVFEFILLNYNIDGNVLKQEHKDLLDPAGAVLVVGNFYAYLMVP